MGRGTDGYESIEDFGVEARTRLIDTRGDEIRLLLDSAFSDFVDAEPDVSLAAFGFHGDDPIADAVRWAMDRFASADLDVSRIHPGSRSFRIFTEVRFWLAQKAGRRGYDQILTGVRRLVARSADDDATTDAGAVSAATCAFGEELAGELPRFRDRTCADLVGFWLAGTKRARRDWFGWRTLGEISDAADRLSKKQRSVYTHDAMFRFLCCFHRLVAPTGAAGADLAFLLTTLSGCPNEPPYRVADRQLVDRGLGGVREIARLRKEGAQQLLHRCVDLAGVETTASMRDQLAATFTRISLGLTTLHALGMEDDQALRRALDRVCDVACEVAS
jgi:hypothetical protein